MTQPRVQGAGDAEALELSPAQLAGEATEPARLDAERPTGPLVDGPALSQDAVPSASGD